MTLYEFFEQLLGTSNGDPIFEIFGLASGLIVVSTILSGFAGAVFNFFKY